MLLGMSERQCEAPGCQTAMGLYREGARFCSSACRQRAYRARAKAPAFAVPDAMASRERWVRWSLEERRGLLTKVPRRLDGGLASVSDPSTWSSLAEASASGVGDGVGFVLGQGIGCWDFDHCIVDGELLPWARKEIAGIPDPVFVETSQSGEGVHVFVMAPEGPGRRIRDGRNIEFYSAGRYIAMTGNPLTAK